MHKDFRGSGKRAQKRGSESNRQALSPACFFQAWWVVWCCWGGVHSSYKNTTKDTSFALWRLREKMKLIKPPWVKNLITCHMKELLQKHKLYLFSGVSHVNPLFISGSILSACSSARAAMAATRLDFTSAPVFVKSRFENSLERGDDPGWSAPIPGCSNVGRPGGVDFANALGMLTLLRPRTGALRRRTFQTPFKKNMLTIAGGAIGTDVTSGLVKKIHGHTCGAGGRNKMKAIAATAGPTSIAHTDIAVENNERLSGVRKKIQVSANSALKDPEAIFKPGQAG